MPNPQYFLILNITPDSFSDGTDHIADGNYQDSNWLVNKANELIKSGANVLDIGAESTRPGAETISAKEEIERLEKFLKVFCEKSDFPLSIDTRKKEVMKVILSEPLFYKNIAFINDVEGFNDEEKLKVIKEIDVENKLKLIAMHSSVGVPPKIKTHMIPDNFYLEKKHLRAGTFFNYGKTSDENLSEEEMEAFFENLCQFFESLQKKAKNYGIKEENLIFDPGLGFGKNLKHSYSLLQLIPKFIQRFRSDIFIGASRKSFIKEIIEKESISKTLNHSDYSNALDLLTEKYHNLCYQVGANLFRVHVHPSEIKAYNIHR